MHIVDQALEKVLKNDPFFKKSNEKEDKEGLRRMLSWTLNKLTYAACDLYSDEEMGWDETIEQLTKSLLKLKGKEKELMVAAKKEQLENKSEAKKDNEEAEEVQGMGDKLN